MNTLMTLSNRMGMKIEMIACTEQYAMSENDPMEVIRATFIKAPRALSKEERETPLTYTIRHARGEPLHIVSTSEQAVKAKDGGLSVTVVESAFPRGKVIRYGGDDPETLKALAATPWIQSDADEIRKLSREAMAAAMDGHTAVLNIERFVADYIDEKTLSVGYASALEVAQSRQGDCTEHALLTAALCRASGIPAQIVFGLVYVDEFEGETSLLGGHAWTRALIDGKWVSLDAALGGFDTGHIALGISNGDPADFFQLIDVIGNLEIVSIE
jgi:hypothetical protein